MQEEDPMTGEVTASVTEQPGVSLTVRGGGAMSTVLTGGKTVKEASEGNSTTLPGASTALTVGTTVKEASG